MAGTRKIVGCPNCPGETFAFMRYCPKCGFELHWSAKEVGSDAEEKGDYAGWALSDQFIYSPWSGELLDEEDSERIVTRAKGFRLDYKCEDCGGGLEAFFDFCPSCGAEVPAWNKDNFPGERTLANKPMDDVCEHCDWELHRFWKYCPWCGEEAKNRKSAWEKLSMLSEQEPDEAMLLDELFEVAFEYDAYHLPLMQLRIFKESRLRALAEEYEEELENPVGPKDSLDAIYGKLRHLILDKAGYGDRVRKVCNAAAHPLNRKPFSEEEVLRTIEDYTYFLKANDI